MSNNPTTTVIGEVDASLDEILGTPGSSNILTPEKPNFLSRSKEEDILKKIEKEETAPVTTPAQEVKETPAAPAATTAPATVPGTNEELESILNGGAEEEEASEETEEKKGGRPKMSKDLMIDTIKDLVEKGVLKEFEDDKPLEKYTKEELTELITANMEDHQKRLEAELPKQFFGSLPQEFQYAAEYFANGGTDLKGLFKSLADVMETRDLDVGTPDGQERVLRTYLQSISFGTPEEIEEEVNGIKDRNELEKKANQFKPKLDAMEQQRVSRKIQEQEQNNRLRQARAKKYAEDVYNTIEPGKLGDLTLDQKTQAALYHGLVQANYQSLSGAPINLFGHLIEKYQVTEPNHGLIAEALWLLSDPTGYRNKIREAGKTEANLTTRKMLKTEEASRTSGGHNTEEPEDNMRAKTGSKLKKPAKGFFQR